MRRVLEVLIAIFLGILITIVIKPLMGPLAPPPPPLSMPESAPQRSPTPVAALPPTIPPRPAGRPAARPSPTSPPRVTATIPTGLLIVQVAVVPTREEAARLSARLRSAGFEPYVVAVGEGFAVRLGAFRERARAVRLARLAAAKGFSVTLIEQR